MPMAKLCLSVYEELLALRGKIVFGEPRAVSIRLEREGPGEVSKNQKKKNKSGGTNFPKCGTGRNFLAILTTTPTAPTGFSFGIRFGQFSVQNVSGGGIRFHV